MKAPSAGCPRTDVAYVLGVTLVSSKVFPIYPTNSLAAPNRPQWTTLSFKPAPQALFVSTMFSISSVCQDCCTP